MTYDRNIWSRNTQQTAEWFSNELFGILTIARIINNDRRFIFVRNFASFNLLLNNLKIYSNLTFWKGFSKSQHSSSIQSSPKNIIHASNELTARCLQNITLYIYLMIIIHCQSNFLFHLSSDKTPSGRSNLSCWTYLFISINIYGKKSVLMAIYKLNKLNFNS